MSYRIKKLEWEKGRLGYMAFTPFRTYEISRVPKGYVWDSEDHACSSIMSLREAKSECQDDFDRTVRECIEEPTQ